MLYDTIPWEGVPNITHHYIPKKKIERKNVEYHNVRQLEYNIIILNFWLDWLLDIVSEIDMTRGHGLESQPPLI